MKEENQIIKLFYNRKVSTQLLRVQFKKVFYLNNKSVIVFKTQSVYNVWNEYHHNNPLSIVLLMSFAISPRHCLAKTIISQLTFIGLNIYFIWNDDYFYLLRLWHTHTLYFCFWRVMTENLSYRKGWLIK